MEKPNKAIWEDHLKVDSRHKTSFEIEFTSSSTTFLQNKMSNKILVTGRKIETIVKMILYKPKNKLLFIVRMNLISKNSAYYKSHVVWTQKLKNHVISILLRQR